MTKWFDCRINQRWCQSILNGHFSLFVRCLRQRNASSLHALSLPPVKFVICIRRICWNELGLIWQCTKMWRKTGPIQHFLYVASPIFNAGVLVLHCTCFTFNNRPHGRLSTFLFITLSCLSMSTLTFIYFLHHLLQFLALKYESWDFPLPRFFFSRSHTKAKDSMSVSWSFKLLPAYLQHKG